MTKRDWIVLIGVAAIAAVVALRYPIIRDCGWLGAVRGWEWVWLFGGC